MAVSDNSYSNGTEKNECQCILAVGKEEEEEEKSSGYSNNNDTRQKSIRRETLCCATYKKGKRNARDITMSICIAKGTNNIFILQSSKCGIKTFLGEKPG